MAKKPEEKLDIRRKVPALDLYLTRIGAELLNFRRYMVKEYRQDNYYVEKVLISIDADNEIVCYRKDYAPTDEERAEIKQQLKGVKLPRSIETPRANVNKLKIKLGFKDDEESFFEFVNRKTGHVIMVQQRSMTKEGKKIYVPWTFWDDAEWRSMEPMASLPFWKPTTDRKKRKKMVHEGAKAAKHVDALCQDKELLAKHPWGEMLSDYEHWGLIGGALAPHRANFDELHAEKPSEVIYVCDNDFPGRTVPQEFAKCYKQSLKCIMFPSDFPPSWDMADPMPSSKFSEDGRWLGKPLESMLMPATRATELVPTGEKGRPAAVLRMPFREEWVHTITPEVFTHVDWPADMLGSEEFNNKVRPFSDVHDTSRLVKTDAAAKSAYIKYDPSQASGLTTIDESRVMNTHVPTKIKSEKGESKPWLEFMEHLVPRTEERLELMRWCATLVARPDLKMQYGVLLISETQGVGKGTLGEKILAPLVGENNVSYPSENEIVDTSFNYWSAHKRLAVIHEIYAGHSSKAYNNLKSIITDHTLMVKKKYQADYQIDNWIHVFACSNSRKAIQLSTEDRRWFLPQVSEELKPMEYWKDFNEWLTRRGGLGIIRSWAEAFVKKNRPVMPGDHAPWSTLKKEVIEESFSPGMALVASVLDRVTFILDEKAEDDAKEREKIRDSWKASNHLKSGGVIILDSDLVRLISEVLYDGRHNPMLERPLTVRKVAKAKTWHVGEEKVEKLKSWGLVGRTARIITNVPKLLKVAAKELGGEKIALKDRHFPLDLNQFKTL